MATEQEIFWEGGFGDSYISRNESNGLLASNLSLFSKILSRAEPINSVLELGCNIGMNLIALEALSPKLSINGVDINAKAIQELSKNKEHYNLQQQSIIEPINSSNVDFTFTKGVLIHINPKKLNFVYDNLYALSSKYICLIEYYNPSPVSLEYRGHQDRLFKRDFCGEMLEKYKDLQLIDYGFTYRNDHIFPQDDMTWFLLKKC
jgi:spore coat polysaccharide biosynthesis protein SpsF